MGGEKGRVVQTRILITAFKKEDIRHKTSNSKMESNEFVRPFQTRFALALRIAIPTSEGPKVGDGRW